MNPADQHRIAPRHLERGAIVYVRQSDPQQVREHTESTRLQRGLRERAIALGWPNPTLIEDDQGITASGFADRPGFQWLLTQVTLRKVGIILCIEASRLSRNSRDWAHLFEMCGYFDTLVADPQQVYDVAIPNDRLVLQIKGTVAELELSSMKTRLRAGIEAKAARGELKVLLPPGYVYDANDQLVMDPDKRVQQATRGRLPMEVVEKVEGGRLRVRTLLDPLDLIHALTTQIPSADGDRRQAVLPTRQALRQERPTNSRAPLTPRTTPFVRKEKCANDSRRTAPLTWRGETVGPTRENTLS